ncbi:XdhC family protein [Brevibacillus panacihumi]|uniref:XdhC family protein n=1 Tax=Brevibacillus panacihumi TaxID=497735 RepID=UPI003D094AFC
MYEQMEIARAIEEASLAGLGGALATVIRVTGSAYRHPGAKMYIDSQGKSRGMISGGCLEADVTEIALNVMETAKPVRKEYVMDEDLVWGLGLGCPGTVEVYIEPLTPAVFQDDLLQEWRRTVLEGKSGVLCTLFLPESDEGLESKPARMFIPQWGNPLGDLGLPGWNKFATQLAQQQLNLSHAKSTMLALPDEGGEIFLDVYQPAPQLLVFGAGHDALPLVEMGATLGFSVTLVDPRPGFNTAERFPKAEQCLLISPQEMVDASIGGRTYVVIMNHHLERDKDALRFALQSKAPYVGMLGPRKRCERIMNSLMQEGITFTKDELSRLYNPIGLNLGADSPEEIAVSILAELVAVHRGQDGGFLRDRQANRERASHLSLTQTS